jgi:hypothetical protein
VREGFGVGDGDLEAIGLDRDAGQDRVDERGGRPFAGVRELLVVFSSSHY